MERTIEAGDKVVVTVNGQQYDLPITAISREVISAGNYRIIPINGIWRVYGYQVPHSLRFLQAPYLLELGAQAPSARPGFTQVPEIDSRVLMNVDPQSLAAACQTNMLIASLCEDPVFWRQKLEKDFPGLSQYRPEGMSDKDQYLSLAIITDPIGAARMGRIDILTHLRDSGIPITDFAADAAVGAGKINVLDWLENLGVVPSILVATSAARENRTESLDWLLNRGYYMDESTLNAAVGNNAKEATAWLLAHGIVPVTIIAVVTAATNGNTEILDLLTNVGAEVDDKTLRQAVYEDHLHVLEWAERKEIPIGRDVADIALYRKNYHILDWLYQRGITPNPGNVSTVVSRDDLDIIRWLLDHKLVDQYSVDVAKGREKLRLLAKYGLYPR